MLSKKPRIVIIGAGIAGLTAANKLYTSIPCFHQLFELCIVEGGARIGGRINSSEFCGDPIELGATWIHGTEGNPIYRIAQEESLLYSKQPWEYMEGDPQDPCTMAEGGLEVDPSLVKPISTLFNNLMDFIRGKGIDHEDHGSSNQVVSNCDHGNDLSVGSFLRRGLEGYWGLMKDDNGDEMMGSWSRKSLEEAVFAMHESTHRIFTSADDLRTLDYVAEREYVMLPGEEITIATGYSRVIESLASVLPLGTIQLGRKVERIEWQLDDDIGPVKLHFCDGTTLSADHVIVTVSLGVLKRGIQQDCTMFNPPLPDSKIHAISKLGFGVVNKVFSQLHQESHHDHLNFPFMQMVFHQPDSELRNPKIPPWMRKSSWFYPIYSNSKVYLSWFTGQEALQIESLNEEEIIEGFSETASNLLSSKLHHQTKKNYNNGENPYPNQVKFAKVMRSEWGTNPLFLGSYSYIAVGSSGDDIDRLSEPLPGTNCSNLESSLQILFAGEATHRIFYSTTHGAYFSGLREADRLLRHYNTTAQ